MTQDTLRELEWVPGQRRKTGGAQRKITPEPCYNETSLRCPNELMSAELPDLNFGQASVRVMQRKTRSLEAVCHSIHTIRLT